MYVRFNPLMKECYKRILFMLLTLLLVHSIPAGAEQTERDPFTLGLEALENENPEKAVRIWSAAAESEDPDYRIGLYFLKTVTAHDMRDHYEEASELYYRGLESDTVSDEAAELLTEDIEFMRPLMVHKKAEQLESLAENRDPQVFSELAEFWESMRVTVTGTYNERLIEHWERCNYVTENYKTNRRHAYDDRGEIYLRFGRPDDTRNGTLLYNAGFAEYVLSTRMSDGGGGGSAGSAVNAGSLMNTIYMVRSYHNYPTYEVWVYTDLSNNRDNVLYVFGNSTGSRTMKLMESVDDFVPSGAFNTSGRNRPSNVAMLNQGNQSGPGRPDDSNDEDESNVAFENERTIMGGSEVVPPGLVLQLMYYRQLATVDEYFGSRYDYMMDRYMNKSMRLSSSIARQFQHINSARFKRRQGRAPRQRSEEVNNLFTVPSDLYAYRFFDEEMNPYLRVYLEADAEEAVAYDELRTHNRVAKISYDKYEIINRLRTYSTSGSPVDVLYDTVGLQQDESEDFTGYDANMLMVRHTDDLERMEADFELHNREEYDNPEIADESPFRNHLKGIGSSEIEVEELLENSGFMASDIIFGYSEIEESGESRLTIAHNKQIPKNRNLNFYYEAYNVPRDEEGLYSFTLTYEIERDRSWIGRLVRFGGGGPSVTIENTEDNSRFSQTLEIVGEELDEGEYTLKITFISPDDEVLLTREEHFTITE